MKPRSQHFNSRHVFPGLSHIWKLLLYTALILAFCLIPVPASGETTNPVHLLAFEYPPFYYEQDGEVKGIAVELVKELFHRMERDTEISLYPLKRALYMLENGEADALLILIRTDEREQFLEFSIPVISVRGLIWYAADRPEGAVSYAALEDLNKYTLGVTLGYSYGQNFDDMIKTFPQVEAASTDVQNFRKLLAHRIDVFPCNEILARGLFTMHPEFQGAFSHSDQSFILWNLRMGISKKSSLIDRIPETNQILTDMMNEGFIDAIVDKYIH